MATDIAPQIQHSKLTSWSSGKTSPPAASSTSLSCALESSMKMWQPPTTYNSSSGSGVVWTSQCGSSQLIDDLFPSRDSRLTAAMDFSSSSWMMGSSSSTPSRVMVSDELSLSSGSSSHGVSRTPSPPSSSSSSSSSAYPSFSSSNPGASSTTTPMLPETYSRKVFVGGLPPDIDQDEIKEHFVQFGPLTVDWPHKAQSKAYFPPKGYAFLLFRDEVAVHRLVKNCVMEEGKLFMFVSSVTQTNKKVQIRPWKLSDSDYIMDHTQPIDPRKTIFIGGVPRPLKACELADIFNSRYGNVCYAGIDCDPELKYPKGAGRVTFSSRVSFMSAVSCRFLQVTYGDIDKKVEVKPYVLDDQMCDECHGMHCCNRYAPYFCGNIHCLRYYCEHCWAAVHSAPGTQNHRCFIKENGDRPRAINFFPSQARLSLPSLP